MKNKAFDIFIRLKGYFFNPDKMWRNIDEKERTNSFVKMVLPLFPAVILSMIVGQVIFAEFDFEKLTVGVLLLLLSYVLGFPLSKFLFTAFFRRFFSDIPLSENKTDVLVAYAYSLLLMVDVVAAVLHDEDLICRMFYVIVAYLLWRAAPNLGVEKNGMVKYLAIVVPFVVFVPYFLQRIMGWIILR